MYKNHVLLLIAVLLFVLTGCSGKTDHRQVLIDTRKAWGEAIAGGDTERIFSFWTEDVVIFPVSEPAVKGIDAARAYVLRNRQELGIRPKTTPLEFAASASGDLGYIIGTHEWVNREGRATMPGRYVSLWRKNEQGEWKCFLEIHSPRPAEDVENVMSNDEARIRFEIDSYLNAWNAGDADALAAHYDEDGDRANNSGDIFRGRATIRDHYRKAFTRSLPAGVERKLSYSNVDVRVVSADAAVVDIIYEVSGIRSEVSVPVRGRNTVFMIKRGGRWMRTAHRNSLPISPDCYKLCASNGLL